MANSIKKELLKDAFNSISKDEIEKIKGGTVPPSKPPFKPGITVYHSCTSLGTTDCWCEPHCIMGISCTSNYG